MTYAEYTSYLSRRIGPAFAAEASAASLTSLVDALANPTPAQLPAGWGTSPRRAPSPAKAYKPAHGGYLGTPVLDNAKAA